jgi:threonine dehydrogenase-like Zn-dependent dehydrogenase
MVRALTVRPGSGDPRVEDVPEPDPPLGSVLVDSLLVGICGTDRELLSGAHVVELQDPSGGPSS